MTLLGTWHFQPDDRKALTTPEDYRYFGWWLRETDAGPLVVGSFSGNTGDDGENINYAAATGEDVLTGTASYAGAAAGKYRLSTSLTTAEGGHWTADAALSANFSMNTISGMVDNFMTDSGEKDWTVALRQTAIAARDADTGNDFSRPEAMSGTQWTIGGVRGTPDGSWQGRFHAPSPGTAPDAGTPGQATGEFQATYGGAGLMIGAFGAHKE